MDLTGNHFVPCSNRLLHMFSRVSKCLQLSKLKNNTTKALYDKRDVIYCNKWLSILKFSPVKVMFGIAVMAITKATFLKIWFSSYMTRLANKIVKCVIISQANNWKLWAGSESAWKLLAINPCPCSRPIDTTCEQNWFRNAYGPGLTNLSHSHVPFFPHSFRYSHYISAKLL